MWGAYQCAIDVAGVFIRNARAHETLADCIQNFHVGSLPSLSSSKEISMAAPARLELFSYWRTSATYRVRVAFNLKGVSPQEHNVDIDAGEQRSESF